MKKWMPNNSQSQEQILSDKQDEQVPSEDDDYDQFEDA